jgi:hypothetical protein
MQNYYKLLASLLDKQIKQLSKRAQQIAYNIVLIQEKIDNLIEAVKAAIKRKSRKRQYIQAEETLTKGEVTNLIAAIVNNCRNNSNEPLKRVRAERRCSRCSEVRHNSRTCKVEIEDVDNSDASN